MHKVPRRSVGYKPKGLNEVGTVLNQLARDCQLNFDAILDVSLHKLDQFFWRPPFELDIPFIAGDPRLSCPNIVRCTTAFDLTDPSILVCPGGCAWEWLGNNSVRINEVSGLTEGHKYLLIFEVVGPE